MTRVQVYLDPKHIDILDLLASQAGTSRSQALRQTVSSAGKKLKKTKKYRTLGKLKGKIWVSPDFDDESDEINNMFYNSKLEP